MTAEQQNPAQEAHGNIAPALADHIDLGNGVTREELVELVTHLAVHAGWPVANSTVPILRKAFANVGAS